jgi:hypothetical protein
MDAGWFPDPTGRTVARYFDGQDWTDRVQGADGQVTEDVLARQSSGLAAPAPAPGPTPAPPPAAGPGWAPPPRSALAKGTGLLGVGLAGFGWLLAALSLLALDWADGATRGDIADVLPSSAPGGLPFADLISYHYVGWAGLALLVLVALGLGAVALGLIGPDPTALRFVVGGLVLVAVVLHTAAVARGLRDNAELGAHLGTAAYLLVLVGLSIGSRSRRPA